MRTRITPADIIVLSLLIILSLAGWVLARSISANSTRVTIDVQGKRQYILDLNEEGTFEVNGPLGKTIVEIRDGRVRVKNSPCPRKFCEKQGWISKGAIVCVPNRVVVTVGASLPEGVDAISE